MKLTFLWPFFSLMDDEDANLMIDCPDAAAAVAAAAVAVVLSRNQPNI
jgi:hypothetical protein